MKVLVTGVGGQLGYDVVNELAKRGHQPIGTDIVDRENLNIFDSASPMASAPYVKLDITDKEAVFNAIDSVKPDAVIHCAAWTAVDAAEDEENFAKVRALNVFGTQNITGAAASLPARPGALQSGEQDRRQNSDDGDDNEQFNKSTADSFTPAPAGGFKNLFHNPNISFLF